ncbi:MAG: aminomethyl-transferring glycine dehydrogenase subunit GcvPB [Candidatus Freyarchaeota archaeon]
MSEGFKQAIWKEKQKVLEPLIFEISVPGRVGHVLPKACDKVVREVGDVLKNIPEKIRRKTPVNLPEVSEIQLTRHYLHLAQMNYAVDLGFYPLGSCTMKYNPKINEEIARRDKISRLHPYQDASTVQGALELLYRLEKMLAEISGMTRVTLQPSAGAHGELTGLCIIRKYHEDKGEIQNRREIIVPDSAHGTNPASANMAGFNVVTIPSSKNGCVDLEALRAVVGEQTAGLMLTNPNTLGIFEEDILEISDIIHNVGGLLYYDGANLNGVLNKVRPGDMGFDIVHFNLHKTFSTPHGGGGPGAGPVGVKEELVPYLPIPTVEYDEKKGTYYLEYERPKSIGKMKGFYGNFGVIVKAYCYILSLGAEGLNEVAEVAVLNANYLAKKIREIPGFSLPYAEDKPRKHECVISAAKLKAETGVTAFDVAKRILDFGIHAPVVYFPQIVEEALMIEPTETETKENLDTFVSVMKKISSEAYGEKEKILSAPHNTSVSRVDEVRAARKPILSWKMYQKYKS